MGDACNAEELEVWEYGNKCLFFIQNPEELVDDLVRLVDQFSLQKVIQSSGWEEAVNESVMKAWYRFREIYPEVKDEDDETARGRMEEYLRELTGQ